MLKEIEVKEFASQNNLDVRPLDHAYRLINSKGKYLIDIYFKKKRNGEIIRNSAFYHKNQSWGLVHNLQELKKYIK